MSNKSKLVDSKPVETALQIDAQDEVYITRADQGIQEGLRVKFAEMNTATQKKIDEINENARREIEKLVHKANDDKKLLAAGSDATYVELTNALNLARREKKDLDISIRGVGEAKSQETGHAGWRAANPEKALALARFEMELMKEGLYPDKFVSIVGPIITIKCKV